MAADSRTRWLASAALAVAALLTAATTTEIRAARGAEGAAEVRGTVKDMDGNPLEGVEVQMTPVGKDAKPSIVKTRKDGTFVFPFLAYNKDRYQLGFVKEGFRIRKIHIVSRQPQSTADRGEGQIFQDDEGTVGPDQKIPPVNAKPGGHVKIEAGLAPQQFFEQMAEAAAAAKAATASAASGAPAPPPRMSALDEARLLSSQGKYAEAAAAMEKSLQEEATGDKWLELGKIRMRTADTDGAKAAFARAAGLDPAIRGSRPPPGPYRSHQSGNSHGV